MNIYSKIRIIIFAAITALASSCGEKNNSEDPVQEKMVFEIDAPKNVPFELGEKKEFDVKAENITRTIIETPKGWTATLTETKFDVTAPEALNDDVTTEGPITVLYFGTTGTGDKVSFNVSVNIPEDAAFTINISNVTNSSAYVKVEPKDKTSRYYWNVVTDETWNSISGDASAVFNDELAQIKKQYPSLTLEDILEGLLNMGDSEEEVSGLPSSTNFYVFAINVNDNGDCYGTSASAQFSTLEPGDPKDCTFDIEIKNLSASEGTVVVTPSDGSVRYWTSIEEVASWAGDAAMPGKVKETLEKYASDKNMDIEKVVEGVSYTGVSEETWDLEANTSYYAYAYAMDEQGNALGDVFKKQFTSKSTDVSDADISLVYRYFDGDKLYDSDNTKWANAKGKVLVQAKVNPNGLAASWCVALSKGDLTDDVSYPDEPTMKAMLQGGYSGKSMNNYYVDGYKTCTLLGFAWDEYGIFGVLHRQLLELTPEGVTDISEVAPETSSLGVLKISASSTIQLPSHRTTSKTIFRKRL